MPLSDRVIRVDVDPTSAVIADERRVVKRHADVGHARVARHPPWQSLEPRGEVIADESDQTADEGRGLGIPPIGGMREAEVVDQAGEGRQGIALAASDRSLVGGDRPARPGGLEDEPRVGREDAPAAGVAEAGAALQDRGPAPRSDHRGELVGRRVEILRHVLGSSESRHGEPLAADPERARPSSDHREIRRVHQPRRTRPVTRSSRSSGRR